MGIAAGVTHFVEAILEVVQGFLGAIVHFFQLIVSSIVGAFQGVVHFVEGTLGFAFQNFFILGTIAAMWFGYMYYTQRQGTAPISSTVKQQKAKY
ncbi:hypothetical protein SLS62_004569 [Diatrype stigma]|uniref:Uncharacterized protein n=1 Tax=Diatrype stigma TaxID=117547 RepID=A0AAN9V2W3_9PEZI